jgi:hypothetical protein
MKTFGTEGRAPRILTSKQDGSELLASRLGRPLYFREKKPWYPLDRRLGGTQSRSRRCDEEKDSQPPPGTEH